MIKFRMVVISECETGEQDREEQIGLVVGNF